MDRASRVSRVVLEPTITRRADATTIGDRLARFARERLPALIDEALEGYAGDARERILARLEIDLGSVAHEQLEARLEERLVGLLRTALFDRFGFPASVVGARRTVAEQSADARSATSTAPGFSDLAASAEPPGSRASNHAGAGSDAWGDARLSRLAAWFEGRVTAGADTIEQTFLDALDADTAALVRLMREHGRHTARRERWVGAMTATMRVRAVQALRPNDAQEVLGDVRYVAARQRAAPVARMRPDDFDDALWQTVFAYLLADRGGRFNRRSFLSALLRGLATRAGLEYLTLIDALLERLGSASKEVERDESLHRILVDLREDAALRARPEGPGIHASHEQDGEHVAREVDPQEDDRMPAEGDARDAQTLAFYLDFGALPWFADENFDPVKVALRIARRSPSRMVALLRGDDAWSVGGGEGGPNRSGRTRLRSVDVQRRQERLAASLDAKARAEWIAEIEPTAARSIVGTLAALDALIEHTPWPMSRRATLRRAISAATLETLVALRAGAFSETIWLERMLTKAAEAMQLPPAELVDVLLLATHSAPGTVRRMRMLRAGLVRVATNAGRDAAPDVVGESGSSLAAAKPVPAAIEGLREASAVAGSGDLAAAFVASWPGLLRALRLTPTRFDAAELRALSHRARLTATGSPKPGATSSDASIGSVDAVLAMLTRLARYHGIPLRRWLAALARNPVWNEADRGRAQLRRLWRRLPREAVRTALADRNDAPGAAQAFVEFFSTGHVDAEAAPWLAMPSRQWLELALQERGGQVMERLRARSADPAVLRRLSAFLRPDAVPLLMSTLESAHGKASKELLDAASAMARRLGRPGMAREARRAWLAALLSPSGAQMSLGTRIARVVEGLARRTGFDAGTVAEHLMAFVSPGSTALREALAALTAQRVTPGSPTDERAQQSARMSAGGMAGAAAATSTDALATISQATAAAAARQTKLTKLTKPTGPHDEISPAGQSTDAPHRTGADLPLIVAYLRYGESQSPTLLHAAFHRLAQTAPRILARLIERTVVTEPGFSRLASLRGETFVLVTRILSLPLAPVAVALCDAAMAFAPSAGEQMRLKAQAIWLRYARRGGEKAMLATLVEATFADPGHRAIEASRGISQNPSAPAQFVTRRQVLARWRRAVTGTTRDASLARDWIAWLSARESMLDAGPPARSASETPERRQPTRAPGTPEDRKPEPPDMPSTPIQVENAGMVMLWPFLSRYFEMLELQRGGRFVDFDAQSRAVHLLHALACNAIARHEALLPLAKVMCGVAPALPLAAGADRERDERELALSEGLLNGVKQNWDKLRGTTIEGLRESFLMRSGRLEREDGAEPHWRLSVEGKAFDVLLDTLPWNLSMVRLAWMPELLIVNWRDRRS